MPPCALTWPRSRGAACRRAFTLIELLVAVAIIGILIAMLIPAVQSAREAARRVTCQNSMRQIGVAITLHEEAKRALPVGCIGCRFTPPTPQRFLSWNIQILPYLEQQHLYERFDLSKRSYDPPNKQAGSEVLPVFLCPSTREKPVHNTKGLWKGLAFTDFCGIYGVEGVGRNAAAGESQLLNYQSLGVMLYEEPVTNQEVVDGLSNTALVGETKLRRRTESEWPNGHNLFAQEQATQINSASGLGNDLGSPHPGGASVVFCDGHISFLPETTEQAVLIALLTKAGGETVALPSF